VAKIEQKISIAGRQALGLGCLVLARREPTPQVAFYAWEHILFFVLLECWVLPFASEHKLIIAETQCFAVLLSL
jgi:hypothetical protein